MRHVIVKLWPGKSEQQKTRLARTGPVLCPTSVVNAVIHFAVHRLKKLLIQTYLLRD